MDQQIYRVVFNGETVPNADVEQVKRNVAALFKVDVPKIAHLFSGKRFVLKESTDLDTVRKYAGQFRNNTGALCKITGTAVNPGTAAGTQQQAGQTAPARTMEADPVPEIPGSFYETRYRVIFKGETTPGKHINDVRYNLGGYYRVEPERLQHLFTGQPVTIKDGTDFWTAAALMNRFAGFGAACRLETIDPPASKTTDCEGSGKGDDDSEERIKSLSEKLYEDLNATYKQVQQEHRIEKKNKEFQKNDTLMGCLSLLIIAAAITLLIATPLRWYMCLLGAIGCFLVIVPFAKTWDTRYADMFLWKMEKEKRKNAPLFAATLKKWVDELPATDRAKPYLTTMADKKAAEKRNRKKHKKYFQIIYPEKAAAAAVPPGTSPDRAAQPQNIEVRCPKCGSNSVTAGFRGFSWKKGILTSFFLGPLGGAIAGSAGENKPVYICQQCRNKWPR